MSTVVYFEICCFFFTGDEFTPEALLAPSCMYTSDALPLVGSIEPIVDDTVVPRGSGDVKEFLGVEPKNVTLDQVLQINFF